MSSVMLWASQVGLHKIWNQKSPSIHIYCIVTKSSQEKHLTDQKFAVRSVLVVECQAVEPWGLMISSSKILPPSTSPLNFSVTKAKRNKDNKDEQLRLDGKSAQMFLRQTTEKGLLWKKTQVLWYFYLVVKRGQEVLVKKIEDIRSIILGLPQAWNKYNDPQI